MPALRTAADSPAILNMLEHTQKVAVNLLGFGKLERETGIEPATSSLGSWRSTAELLPLVKQNKGLV